MENECPICYNNIDDTVKCLFECKHFVCMRCYISLSKRNHDICIICRRDINAIQFLGGSQLLIKFAETIKIIHINLKFATIRDMKEIVAYEFGYSVHDVRLVFSGKALADDKMISNYDIKENATIYFVTALRGD